MDAERWKRLDDLFQATREMDRDRRERFLCEECADDPDLRAEVESLIRHDAESGATLERAIDDAARAEQPIGDLAGRAIGPYRLVSEIGSGGMGAVWLGVRDDGEFHKEVAVKLIRGFAGRETHSRFRAERNILASLEHPNVARLLDSGATADGIPYVVMERVDGQPIDVWCEEHGLDTRERLRLFLGVCSAVEYAHRNLIVHRDLKPGNILVTSDGVPKLLDFGIAKLLAPDTVPHSVVETSTSMRLMTPRYASPEQVRGEPITTATDVYALGVVLFELLTGKTPYRLETDRRGELERAICEQQPDRLSATRRRLAGDLDNIVLMALRKEPERRYASVAQFADDLRRYLGGRPVIARPSTLRYRTTKFVGRHRFGLATAAGIVVLIVGLVGFYTDRVTAERDRARLAAAKAERVAGFLSKLFEVSDPAESRGASIPARELIDRGAERIERELAAEPDVQAAMLAVIGDVYRKLGLYDDADRLLTAALRIRRTLHDGDHPDIGQSLDGLAHLRQIQGESDEAERLHREALAMRLALFGPRHPSVLESRHQLGLVFTDRSELAEAERIHSEIVALRREIGDPKLGESLNALASVKRMVGRYDEAEALFEEALALYRDLHGDDHPETIAIVNNLGNLVHEQGDLERAAEMFAEVVRLRRRLYGEEHVEVAMGLANLAVTLASAAREEEALPLHHEAREMFRRTVGADHLYFAIAQDQTAGTLHNLGRYDEAQALYEEVLEFMRMEFGPRHVETARSLDSLGGVHLARGDQDLALRHYHEAAEIFEESLGEASQPAIRSRLYMAQIETNLKRYDEAEASLTKQLQLLDNEASDQLLNHALALVRLGRLRLERGDAAGAEQPLREGIALQTKISTPDNVLVLSAQVSLGDCLVALGRTDDAEQLLRETHTVLVSRFGASDPRTREAEDSLVELRGD